MCTNCASRSACWAPSRVSCSPAGCTPSPSTTATRCDRRRHGPSPAAPRRARAALRGPPQRRLRIAPRDRIDQSLQILREPGSRSRIGVRRMAAHLSGAGRSSESKSARPRSTVDSEIPVASPQRTGPIASARASAAAHNRRVRSSSTPCAFNNRYRSRCALIDHNPQFYITSQPFTTKSRALRRRRLLSRVSSSPRHACR